MNKVISHYETSKRKESDRLSQSNCHRIEYLTTVFLLEKYLPESGKLLDLGAGGGVYSFHFAEKGYEVTATDFVPKHVEEIKQNIEAKELENISAAVVDATDLSAFSENEFDIVLNLGPMYHLIDFEKQKKCVSETLRVLKPGGTAAFAYINKHFMYSFMLKDDAAMTEKKYVEKFIAKGFLVEEDEIWTEANFFTPSEFEDLFNDCGAEIITHAGVDGAARLISERINSLTESELLSYLENYHFKYCTEKSILGLSNHGLIIVRKKEELPCLKLK